MQHHRSLESNVVTAEADNYILWGRSFEHHLCRLAGCSLNKLKIQPCWPPLVRHKAPKAVSAGLYWFTYQPQVLIVSQRLSRRNRLVLNHLDTLLFLGISPPLYTRYTLSLPPSSLLSLQALIVVYRSIIIRPSFYACMYLSSRFVKRKTHLEPSHPIPSSSKPKNSFGLCPIIQPSLITQRL